MKRKSKLSIAVATGLAAITLCGCAVTGASVDMPPASALVADFAMTVQVGSMEESLYQANPAISTMVSKGSAHAEFSGDGERFHRFTHLTEENARLQAEGFELKRTRQLYELN